MRLGGIERQKPLKGNMRFQKYFPKGQNPARSKPAAETACAACGTPWPDKRNFCAWPGQQPFYFAPASDKEGAV
jgi:hypothetical protein